ncbi:MAG: hypothetical protein ABR508_07790 [Candidatus Baltobacteraceae bacterium]
MEVVYYTCLNNKCEHHRNVFVEGDPEHADCARERLYLQGQEQPAGLPSWIWFALPAAAGAGLLAYFLYRRSGARSSMQAPETLREDAPRQTWSGSHSQAGERPGHAVPPPIA